jgi:predicted amidohydrolase YtcJ
VDDEKLSPMEWRYHMLGAKGDDRTHDWLVLERHDQAMRAELERVEAERRRLAFLDVEWQKAHTRVVAERDALRAAARAVLASADRDGFPSMERLDALRAVVEGERLPELAAWQKRVLESDEPVLKQPITRFHEARAVVEGETPQP